METSTMDSTTTETTGLFVWPDYLVFSAMLGVSAGIGVYYGFVGKKSQTTEDFLMGGKSLGVFPVASSLVVSFVSAITLLGQPSEVYTYGTQFWLAGSSYPFVLSISGCVYLPVFHQLQLTSVNEYLEMRFSRSVRLLASLIYIMNMTLYMAIVVYAPSLALSQVTGMNVYGCVVAIFFICTFYTTLGGLKAVVWTDTLQMVVMFFSMAVIITKGVSDAGGLANVWDISHAGERLEFFNTDLDPRTRHSVWGIFLGSLFLWLGTFGCNQAQVQRYLSMRSMRSAQWALFFTFFGLFGILTVSCYTGLVVYAKYHACDPILSNRITTADQIVPLFVLETVGNYPGLAGLFVAGVFSGALSTVSTGLNSLAAITLEDFVRGTTRWRHISDEAATKLSKLFAIMYGLLSFGLVFVAEQLGGVLQASFSVAGIIGGPLLALFTLGMLVPWVNKRGALIGSVVSLLLTMWLGVGANVAKATGQIIQPKLPLRTIGCNATIHLDPSPMEADGDFFTELYRVSYVWYPPISFLITFIVGVAVSVLGTPQDLRHLDPKLISPVVHKAVRRCCSVSRLKDLGWLDMGADLHKPTCKGEP